jgi:hypothetical protein
MSAILKPATATVRSRVRLVPVTPYAITFHRGDVSPRTYLGNRDPGGPVCEATPEGIVNDGFIMLNYIPWVEERVTYEVEPDPWEVA